MQIPKIKISNANLPPGFDYETFQLCRKNELFRAKSKGPNRTPEYYCKRIGNSNPNFSPLIIRRNP